MTKYHSETESAESFEQKHHCILVLDTSSSMETGSIYELNRGLEEFCKKLAKDEIASQRIELSIISFGDKVARIRSPKLIQEVDFLRVPIKGSPAVEEAVYEAIKEVDVRRIWYKETGQNYYRPSIILISWKAYYNLYHSFTYTILKRGLQCKAHNFCNITFSGDNHLSNNVISLEVERRPLSSILWDTVCTSWMGDIASL